MWILIWVIVTHGGVSTGTTEFNTKKACESAAANIKSMESSRYIYEAKAICQHKGAL